MSDTAKLREALAYFDDAGGLPPEIVYDLRQLTVMAAARDYLALLESDSIVIRKEDGEWPEIRLGGQIVVGPILLDALSQALKEKDE